jgi:dienelactone hydrolase
MKKYLSLAITCILVVAHSSAQLNPVSYTDGNSKLSGLAAIPKKKLADNPGILILPAWKGIDQHAKDSALQLSALGYHAFVADIYGEGNYPTNAKEAGERSGYYKKNHDQYQTRIRLAMEQLLKAGANPEKIVIIGYCFGGTGALEAARGQLPVKGVVSFHGSLAKNPERKTTAIITKVLVCHGADDPYESPEGIVAFQNEMRTANADWQMIYYANAVHSFTDPAAGNDNSKGAAYNEKAAKRSWEHFMIFLKEVL